MDDKRRSDTFKSPSNLLLSGARGGFSLDDFSASPLLVPVTENSSSVLTGDVDVDLSAGSSSVLPSAPAPAAAPVPAAAPAAPAAPGPELAASAAPSGFASTFGSFTSALFGSLPAAPTEFFEQPLEPPPPQPQPTAEDAFQPVSLEPVTGPTPTFYNPGSIAGLSAGHGAQPLHPQPTPQPPPTFVNQVGGGRPFVPQPSDLLLTRASTLLQGPPPQGPSIQALPLQPLPLQSSPLQAPPLQAAPLQAPVEPLFFTPTGLPPAASPFATPTHSVPSSGPPSRPPSRPPSSGPPPPLFAAPPSFGTPTSPPAAAFGTPTGPPPGPPFAAPFAAGNAPPPAPSFGSPVGAAPPPLFASPAGPPPPGSAFATPTGPPPAGSSFATPTGPPPPGPGFGPPPSTGSSGNAFRLGGRRPVYAPVPGLETLAPTPTSTSAPVLGSTPTNPIVMAPTVDSPTMPSPVTPEVFSGGDYFRETAMPLENSSSPMYRPVYQHWFYKKEMGGKTFWEPFTMSDSMALETQFLSPDLTSETEVPTDGSRYNVNILRRQRTAVYWEEPPAEVRRCSWYYKNHAEVRYVPYDENVATRLEEEYKLCYTKNDWQGRVEFPNGEVVVFHSANAIAHYLTTTPPDAWGNTPVSPNIYADGTQHRPRVVKRGVDEFHIEDGESETVDHLLFLVHGIGSACDLKFRSVVEVVDDFRSVTQQLVESHFSASVESGKARRIEVLPVSWHEKLHSEDIQRQLKSITLPSIPLLRNLTNDTLLDILFYTSPVYCQTIIDTVGKELNRLYELFLKRNPNFTGGVSLGGHSLGSLILFDLLWHQKGGPRPGTPCNSPSTPPPSDVGETIHENPEDAGKTGPSTPLGPMKSKLSRKISYVMMGPAGTGQPFISYPQLTFRPENFFALGSPIGVFVTVRGIDKLGEDFKFPTCPSFFNIFHPYDLVAYRVETLIKADMENVPPVLIPHHKGRKRMHLELKETVARMGADLKQRVFDSVKSTWNSVYQLASFHRNNESLTEEMNKVIENEMLQQSMGECSNSAESESNLNIVVGKLNGGRRIDYVLQEAPFESFNGYLFSIGSHVCYWKSEDTMLLMLKEMYRSSGVNVDNQVPQQQINPPMGILSSASTSESLNTYSQAFSSSEPALLEPSPLFPTSSHSQQIGGMDPTAPPSDSRVAGPPPVSGFFRK